MQEENTPALSAQRGEEIGPALQSLEAEYDWIGEARGMGLMRGLEIVTDPESKTPDPSRTLALLEAAKDEGLLLGAGGLHGNVIRLGPSMLITQDELAEGVERLARACARADGESS
jgi:4-aminobutyrate aminotransferase